MPNNYFNTTDPLNLNQGSLILGPRFNNGLEQFKYNTDSEFRRLFDEEEQKRQEEIRRQWEEAKKRQEALIAREKSQLFVDKMSSMLSGKTSMANTEELWKQAEYETIHSKNPDTGKYKYPGYIILETLYDLDKKAKHEQEYEPLYNSVNNLAKLVNSYEDTDTEIFKDDVYEYALDSKQVTDKKDFDEVWSSMDVDDKVLASVSMIGNKYLKGDTLEQFNKLDYQTKFEMLCALTSSDPSYKSLSLKLKEETEAAGNKASEGWLSTIGLGKSWRDFTTYATNRFMYGISGGNGYNLAGTYIDVVGGGAFSAIGNLGNLVGSAGDSVASFIYNKTHDGGEKEDIDAKVRKSSDAFINKVANPAYTNFMSNASDEDKLKIVDSMKSLSRDEYFGSNYFRLHEGDEYTKNVSDNELIKEYFNIQTRAAMFGELDASKALQNYWQDIVASNQSFGDKTLATGALLLDTFSADVAAFAGIVANPLFMAVDTHGSYNPEDWTVDGEGYSDALVKRNGLVSWASGLLETGCWFTDDQEKYKNLGLSKDQLYRTVDLENQFMSANDIGDIIGQYGFTAATTAISMGGSTAVKAMATSVARNAPKLGLKGTIARSLLKKELKGAIKAGLASGATETELTTAMEVAAEMGSKTLYRGNLGISAIVGTSEGALEAKSTYDTFVKDNKQRLDDVFNLKMEILKNASKDDLRNHMLSKGYPSTFIKSNLDSNSYIAEFTPQQYELARQEILSELQSRYEAALDRMEDDAADAACANFISNSFINGALNIFCKELSMSKDARNSIRAFKGDKKLTDLVSIEKGADNKWHATINKAVLANKDNSWWGNTMQALKTNGAWNKTKAVANAFGESNVGKIVKNAGGEGIEEFTQGVSDTASRAAFENDLNQYMSTVYDKDAREQFITDWGGIVNAGMNSITSDAINADNIKAAIFGFASTLIGGTSPGAGISRLHKPGQSQKEATGAWTNIKEYSKWALSNLGGFYDGAIRQALSENNSEYATAQRLLESTERWLQNDKNQELTTHMGGAIGFANSLQLSLLAGDDFMAKNHHLGMAVENALMMKALKGTAMYDEYLKALLSRLDLSSITESDEAISTFFDLNGNLNGNNLIQPTEGVLETPQEAQIRETAQNLHTLISQFKNTNSQNFTSGMTDLEITKRIVKNAQEMLELNNRVEKASQTLAKVFHQLDVDPLVLSTYIYAMLSQQDARDRRNQLTENLLNAVDVTKNENFSEEDKKAITELPELHLNSIGVNLAVKYGSIDNALKERTKLQLRINQLDSDAHSKKTKIERKEAANQRREVEKELRLLDYQLKKANIEVSESTNTQSETVPGITSEENPIILLDDEATSAKSSNPLISVKDLIEMSPKLRYEVLTNRNRFSDEQNAIIDRFIDITRQGLSAQKEDIALTNDEVIADYKDLYKLIEKSNTYDKLLQLYINNPKFLNDRAGELQALDRTRTLRYLYRDDLQLKEGETPLDMLDRVEKKVEELKKQNKNFDAQTLLNLVTENEAISKLQNTVADISKMQIMIAMTTPGEVLKPEFAKAMMALLTIASNSDMSVDEIKQMLDNNDVDNLTKILKQLLNNGEYTLNRYLQLVGLELIADLENADLGDLIQVVKNYTDLYYLIKGQSEQLGKPHVVLGTAAPSTHQDPASLHKDSPIPAGIINNDGSEPIVLKITSPGEVLTNTPQGILLLEFLKQHQASSAVLHLTNSNNTRVHFMVTRDFGMPLIFAVLELDKNTSAKKGVHFLIGGKYYLVIGAVGATLSNKLALNASSVYSGLNDSDNRSALLLESTLGFNVLGEVKSIGELNQEDAKPLKELLGNSIDRIKSWINEFISSGKRKDTINEDNEKSSSFVDQYGYPVSLINNGDIHMSDFPIGNTTLSKLIGDPNKSSKDIIQELKTNKFFETFFNVWETLPATTKVKGTTLYDKLLGNFFFLGYNKNNVSTEESHLNARIENGNLVIDSYNHESTVLFPLPMSANNTAAKDELALLALKTILANTVGGGRLLTFGIPLLNWKIIENKNGLYNSTDVANERARIQGLIQSGLLYGFAPSAISRDMSINNPYAGSSQSIKPIGGTNTGSPLMDPINNGTLPGGTIDIATGQVLEGAPQTTSSKVEEALTEAVKKAENIVTSLIARSKQVTLNGNAGYRNEGTNTNYGRVTSTEQAFIGASTEPWQGTLQELTISTAFGNIIDNTFRAALDILNSNNITDAEVLYNEILKDSVFRGKTTIPCHSKYQIKKVLNEIIAFKQLCDLKGWNIVPKDIRAFGLAPVTKGGVTIGTIPVAGTLDILVYDNEGIFHIIDMKTKNMDSNIDGKILDSSEGWTALVSTYQALLLLMYPDMVFGLNYIMPIGVKYNLQSATPEIEDDGMTVKNQMAAKEPQMLASMRGKKNAILEDYLYPIDTRNFQGYEYDRLSEDDLSRVIPINTPIAVNPITTSAPEATTPVSIGTSMEERLTNDDMDDFLSKRTKRQSRFTEFVNNHVANLVRPKLNIVSKAIVKIKELTTHTGYVDKIIRLDFADMFFNGDVLKFLRLCGEDISIKALPTIIENLRKYYLPYSNNRAQYVLNIYNRYLAANLIYRLLNNKITEYEVEQKLSEMNIQALNIPELVEYFTSENPEETAKSILSKLEKSLIHTIENYRQRLNEFTLFMDSIDAKLDFLNSGLAINMLGSRITSIRESILNNNFEEVSYEKNNSLEDLLSGKQGNYGALKLLRGIATGSKNKHFRKLAANLLTKVKANNLSINITLDNGLITDIEGSTNDTNITIHKTSLDSYEHLERVLLHELLHAVVKASPEIRTQLESYLDNALTLLTKLSDMSREDIIKDHYGFTNVDEFISEYFTNLAFLESLKNIPDTSEDFNNIFEKVAHNIKSIFTKENSIFDEVTPIMENLISTHNTESTRKSAYADKSSLVKTSFDRLPSYLQLMITLKGFSSSEFDALPSVLQELLTKCCL